MVAWSGCKTQRVYDDETPAWIRQATGQEDVRYGNGFVETEQQGKEDGRRSSRQQREQRRTERAAEGPPGVEFGPPEVSVTVEGEDY